MSFTIVLGYFFALLMGAILGLVGGGGSILTVPILTYIFLISAIESTAYSLFIVGISSIFGAVGYFKKDLINFRVGIIFSLPALMSVYSVRRFLMPILPNTIIGIEKNSFILLIFAIVMLFASYSMLAEKKKKIRKDYSKKIKYLMILVEGLIVGAITGFVGAGGGFLIVPALNILANLKMKEAIGTSLFIISIKSLIGFIGDVQTLDVIRWNFLGIFTMFSLIGIYFGLKLSHYVSETYLKKGFGVFIIVLSSFIIAKQLL